MSNEIQITEEKFRAYQRVQESGEYNMIMHSQAAAARAGLDINEYAYIIDHYNELYVKYGDPE